ncbi:hypothetical protein P8C59_006315 [Phyllachora maydis]|uniref:Uncharacterized protein n=1 Tax=Phyllachora maydis TaxID=1825666 RepID=A0AAD9I7G3_9PEZI|nr:hypothetical protein P8C59_006315 [Phyllachora maydis]
MLRDVDPTSWSKKGRKIDLILAIGAQPGVRKEFSAAITGQVEKLGDKSSGLSRSGRLDIRYLIASVMQVFALQPRPSKPQDNPLVNDTLMATLLVSHLDVYFNTNLDVRFLLLEYPEEYLTTVLALRKLIGEDMANFLLTSIATDSEIATFISSIWKILISLSDFYIPEHTPRTIGSQEEATDRRRRSRQSLLLPPSTGNHIAPNEERTAYGNSAPQGVTRRLSLAAMETAAITAGRPAPPAPTPPATGTDTGTCAPDQQLSGAHPAAAASSRRANQALSLVSSGRSAASAGRSMTAVHRRPLHRRSITMDAQLGALDKEMLNDESDMQSDMEDFDADDRIFLAKYHSPVAKKANTRKALKWLGLA